jgi:hypothetical protein
MRAALEAAMGLVISNARACEDFLSDPAGFATRFTLDHVEVESLVAMQDDLADLMPAFVVKRRQSLSTAFARTMRVLGDQCAGQALTTYVDDHPPPDRVRSDWVAFGDYLVEELDRRAADRRGRFVADVARFDRARAVAQQVTGPLGSTRVVVDLARPPKDRPLRFAEHASLDTYGWDLRTVGRFDPEAHGREPFDACTLMSFHAGSFAGPRLLRIPDAVVPALLAVRGEPGLRCGAAAATSKRARRALNTLTRLLEQGALL